MLKAVSALVLFLAACAGDDGQQQGGCVGSGAIYDQCVAPTDCLSGNCHYYEQSNFTVCTQACDANNPCPVDSTGQPGTCNNKGICKPAAANACSP